MKLPYRDKNLNNGFLTKFEIGIKFGVVYHSRQKDDKTNDE